MPAFFFLPLETLWRCSVLEPGNNLHLVPLPVLRFTLCNLRSFPFISKYSLLGCLHVVIFFFLIGCTVVVQISEQAAPAIEFLDSEN